MPVKVYSILTDDGLSILLIVNVLVHVTSTVRPMGNSRKMPNTCHSFIHSFSMFIRELPLRQVVWFGVLWDLSYADILFQNPRSEGEN